MVANTVLLREWLTAIITARVGDTVLYKPVVSLVISVLSFISNCIIDQVSEILLEAIVAASEEQEQTVSFADRVSCKFFCFGWCLLVIAF